jgi:hypothetical protein
MAQLCSEVALPCILLVALPELSRLTETSQSLLTKIERIIVLLSASPEGEARLPMPKGMAYKE